MSTALAAAAILAPVAAAVLGLLGAPRLRHGPAVLAVGAATVTAGLTVALLLTARGAPPQQSSALLTPTGTVPVTVGVLVDTTAAAVASMVGLVALAVQVYSVGWLRDGARYPSFAALVSLFTAAMLLVVLAGDLLVLYVGWEVMGLCSYLLIGHHWEHRPNAAAAVKAFLMTRVGDVGFLFGIFVLGVAAGSFRITDVLAAVPTLSPGTLTAGTMLLAVGVVAKAAQFPLHSWLPDAMAGPAPVSALIHAATMVAAGAYVVARLHPAFTAAPLTLDVLGVIAAISMLGAALAALAVTDLKRVLAYSTISQVAVMLAALAVGSRTAGVAHLLSHAAFKALLFLVAGVVVRAAGTALLTGTGGLRRVLPGTAVVLAVGLAALAAIPPTSGFVSKEAVLHAVWGAGSPVGTVVLLALLTTTVVTAAYATRTWLLVCGGTARSSGGAPGRALTVPPALLAVAAMVLGAAGFSEPGLRPSLGGSLLTVGLVAVGVLAGTVLARRSPSPLLAGAFGTDTLYERTVVPAVGRLAGAVVRVDDGLVGATVSGTGRGAWLLGGGLRLSQNGNAQFYLTGVLVGVLVLAAGAVVR